MGGFRANMMALSEGVPEPLGYGRGHMFPLSTGAGVKAFLTVPNHKSSRQQALGIVVSKLVVIHGSALGPHSQQVPGHGLWDQLGRLILST